jgi:hypothetical protein
VPLKAVSILWLVATLVAAIVVTVVVSVGTYAGIASECSSNGIAPEGDSDTAARQKAAGNKDDRTQADAAVPDELKTAEERSRTPGYAADTKPKKSKWRHHFWCHANAAEVALAILTFALCLVTGGLVAYTRWLWAEAKEASANQLEAGGTQSRRELRAYVGVTRAGARAVDIGLWGVRIDFDNKGQTPAHDVEFGIDINIFDLPLPPSFAFSAPSMGRERWTMVPGATTSPEVRMHVGDMEPLLNQQRAIFVWGELTYVDVFGDRATVPFRYRVRQTLVGWELRPEQEGNQSQFPRA